MEHVSGLLNQGWFGTAIGLVGIALAILFFLRQRVINRIAYQSSGVHLIGGAFAELPEDVLVNFKGIQVPRLSQSMLVFWNAGTTTIRGSDVVNADPVRIELPNGTQILDARVTKSTRAVNQFQIGLDIATPSRALLNFDFLDPGDGARITFLHTSEERYPSVYGTIRGIKGGCINYGRLPSEALFRPRKRSLTLPILRLALDPKGMAIVTVVFGGLVVLVGIFPESVLYFLPKLGNPDQRPLLTPGKVNWTLVIAGLVYLFPGGLLWWARRVRYPRELVD
jgi:hypothetical protein